MNTDIEYLKLIEKDLHEAADRESGRLAGAMLKGSIKRNTGRGWAKVAGAAAAFLIVAGAIGFVVRGGLGSDASPAAGGVAEVGDAVASDGAASPAPAEAPAGEAGFLDDQAQQFRPGDRPNQQLRDLSKIVRDGRIGIVVPDGGFGNAVGDLTLITERHGGFILSSSTEHERSGTFVLRIPAKRFDRAIGDVRDLGTIRFQEVRGEDVTAEFIDFQARLRILLARKALLFDLFQQADTTGEILEMGRRVDDAQLQIERIQGELRFISGQVAESTLRVSIQERNAPEAAPEEAVDNPNLGSSIDLAVQGFLRIVGAVIVGLGYLIPLTALALLAFGVVYIVRRQRAAR
jgi:Domain of unknown function (DUF4349)